MLTSANDVDRAVRATPERVAANAAGSAGVLLKSDEEDVGPCGRGARAPVGARGLTVAGRAQAPVGGGRNSVPSGTSKPVRTALS